MDEKPTYEDLEKKVKELKREANKHSKAEEVLRESENFYKGLIENLPVTFYMLDPNGIITHISENIGDILEYTPEDLIGKKFSALISGLDKEKYNTPVEKRTGDRATRNLELRLIGKQGQITDAELSWVEISANGLYEGGYKYSGKKESRYTDPAPKFLGCQGLIENIGERKRLEDERKKAEQTLQESEKKYRTILETIEEGYYEVDLNGNFTFFNDSMAKILKFSRDELAGRNIREYLGPETAEEVFEQYKKVSQTGWPEQIQHEVIRGDGTIGYLESSVTIITEEGQTIGFRSISRDVTERRKTEQALLESQASLQRFKYLTNQANDAIYYIDPETSRVLDVNKKACISTGYDLEELLKMGIIDIDPEISNIRLWKEHVEELKKTGHRVMESKQTRKDGTRFPVEINMSYVSSEEGDRIVGVARDITERVELEKRLKEAQKLEMIGLIAGGLAHNLNGPLQGVMGGLELMGLKLDGYYKKIENVLLNKEYPQLESLFNGMRESMDEYVRRPMKSADVIKSIVHELLIRVREDKQTDYNPIDIGAILNSVMGMLNHNQEFKNNITQDFQIEDVPEITGLPVHFSMTYQNLIKNAMDAMYGQDEKHIRLGLNYIPSQEEIYFSIRDNGKGIAPENLEKIFEPFFTTKPKIGAAIGKEPTGTGFGLASVNGTIMDYGGRMEVKSEPGKGSTFSFYVPIQNKFSGGE